MSKKIVGFCEWGSLPDLGVPAIKMKMDTGAKYSALHAENLILSTRDGRSMLSFELKPLSDFPFIRRCEAECVGQKTIKTSGGLVENRYLIETHIRLGNDQWTTFISLTDRSKMSINMLLGRDTLWGRFVVDPEYRYCFGKLSMKEIGRKYGESL